MKILLVGGTGLLSGETLNCALKNNNYNIYILNRGKKKKERNQNVKHLKANIKDRKTVSSLLENLFFDVIVDFICYTKEDLDYNFSLFSDKCKQYILISSCAVYNKEINKLPYKEDAILGNPSWKYSLEKVNCEKRLIELCESKDIYYTIVRPSITYDNTRIPYGVMPTYGYHWTLIARLLNNKPILLWNEGENIATITHVKDFAIGLVGLFANSRAYNEAFHIVGDRSYKWKNIIDTLSDILEVTPNYYSIPSEVFANELPNYKDQIKGGRGMDLLLNNSKIKAAVPSFNTNIELREGLIELIKFHKKNNFLCGIDYKYDGLFDKIIHKYNKKYNPQYIDYLENGRFRDRTIYIINRYGLNKILTPIGYTKKKIVKICKVWLYKKNDRINK